MKPLSLLVLFFIIIAKTSFTQPCHCNYTITLQQKVVSGSSIHANPGDTICIEAGTRDYLYLTSFTGDSLHYIVFINCGGSAVFQNNVTYGIKFSNSKYFKFTGTGVDSIKYGIKVLATAGNSNGISLDDKSTNFEVDHIEIANTGFAGIMSKTDPKCDLSTNRGFFTQYNTIFHDNYIHNTGGEGLYIGNSFYNGNLATCNGVPDTLYPHDIKGVRVYNNIVENTHWDGIQVSCATEDCEIYGNRVTGHGTDATASQNNGIQIGGGTTGLCYNNFIANGTGNGIAVFGNGNVTLFNNIIVNSGQTYFPNDPTKRVYGIFCSDVSTIPGSFYNFLNNTIINVKTDGIRFYSLLSANNHIINNIILHPGSLGSYSTNAQSYIYLSSGVTAAMSNNYTDPSMVSVHFRDSLAGNYRLLADSPAKDFGMDVSLLGVTFDDDNLSRPYASAFDAGAFEYHPENVWTGALSSSWDIAANWSKAGVPLPEDNVVIPAGMPHPLQMVSIGKVCHDLLICSGAELILNSSAYCTISGNLTIQEGGALNNQGTLNIKGNLLDLNP